MEGLIAIVEGGEDGRLRVLAPKLGVFIPEVDAGQLVSGGQRLGYLRILNHRHPVRLPSEVSGRVIAAVPRPGQGVEYRGLLASLSTEALALAAAASGSLGAEGSAEEGELIRAPIHGIFYLRPSPGAAPFVEAGQVLKRGQTVGLIEVMKTFNPVVFEGAGVPDAAVLVETLARDMQEVEAGQPLLRFRASP